MLSECLHTELNGADGHTIVCITQSVRSVHPPCTVPSVCSLSHSVTLPHPACAWQWRLQQTCKHGGVPTDGGVVEFKLVQPQPCRLLDSRVVCPEFDLLRLRYVLSCLFRTFVCGMLCICTKYTRDCPMHCIYNDADRLCDAHHA